MTIRYVVTGTAVFGLTLLATNAFGQAPAPSSPPRRITSENRLFMRFIEDAAIVPSYWLEGQATFQSNLPAFDPDGTKASEADELAVGPVFAMNVAEDFEFGGRIDVAYRDPKHAGSDTGLTDLDLWGKFSVVSDPVHLSLGIVLTAPTGDKDKFLGTGETNVEFFAGLRKDFAHLSLAGNAGMRINQDPDFAGIQLDGKNSVLLGGALLVPAGQKIVLSAEWALETERYEGQKNDSRLMGGFEYRHNQNLLFRGAAGGGLAKGSANLGLLGSAVWLF